MDDAAANDQDSPSIPDPPLGYLTLVARVWLDTEDGNTRIRGSLTNAHTGAQVPLDLTALVAFLRTSLGSTWGEPMDRPSR
jgi:hypothetical protein